MKEFIKRLKQTSVKVIRNTVSMLLIAIFVGLIAGVLFILPMWLLSFVFGENSVWWIVVLFVGFPVIAEWEKIKNWFNWQFIEPFKK